MDIGKIFEGLNEDYKDIILAIAIGFPVAYTDCWKLQPAFQTYDLMHQIFLALSISELFVALGIAYCIAVWTTIEFVTKTPLRLRFSIILSLMPVCVISCGILSGIVKSLNDVVINYLSITLISLTVNFIAYKLNNRK